MLSLSFADISDIAQKKNDRLPMWRKRSFDEPVNESGKNYEETFIWKKLALYAIWEAVYL